MGANDGAKDGACVGASVGAKLGACVGAVEGEAVDALAAEEQASWVSLDKGLLLPAGQLLPHNDSAVGHLDT